MPRLRNHAKSASVGVPAAGARRCVSGGDASEVALPVSSTWPCPGSRGTLGYRPLTVDDRLPNDLEIERALGGPVPGSAVVRSAAAVRVELLGETLAVYLTDHGDRTSQRCSAHRGGSLSDGHVDATGLSARTRLAVGGRREVRAHPVDR